MRTATNFIDHEDCGLYRIDGGPDLELELKRKALLHGMAWSLGVGFTRCEPSFCGVIDVMIA